MKSHITITTMFLATVLTVPAVSAQTDRQNPRAAVQSFFALLKTQQYDALFDHLPSQIQQQTTREQLVQSLKRLDSFIQMERIELGRLQQRGNFAIIDTSIFGRLRRPMKYEGGDVSEGRVVVQQYLMKEGKQWRIITADDRTKAFFLRQNPDFNRGFQLSSPQFAFKKAGVWQELGPPTRPR